MTLNGQVFPFTPSQSDRPRDESPLSVRWCDAMPPQVTDEGLAALADLKSLESLNTAWCGAPRRCFLPHRAGDRHSGS